MASLLPTTWEVPAVFRSRLGERGGRQRMMSAEGHLLLVLHKIPEPGNPERDSVFFWRTPKGEWRSTERGSGVGALKEYFDDWRKTLDQVDDHMEGSPTSEAFFAVLQRTTPLLRSIRNTHRTLQEAREECPDDRAILVARDAAGDLERGIELLHTDAQHGLDFMLAKQAEEQAKQSHQLVVTGHRLNLLIALFFPLTAVASVFGMNLVHGFEDQEGVFWIALGSGLVVGVILLSILTAKPKAQPTSNKTIVPVQRKKKRQGK